jgi:hypothetical protein
MSWVTLDRMVSKEALSDEAIRRQLEQDARPLRSHTAGMGDEDLLAKLRGLGVDADREKLANLCAGALSAEEVVSERLRLHDWDADWAWICVAALWERWWPDKVCLELLDDKVQAGYETDQRNDFVASGRIWLDAWSDVLRLCDAVDARSIREFDDRFPMTQSLFNWCQDLEMALQNGGEHDPELRTARLEMAAEWLRRFPREDGLTTGNFRRALADSYFETGQQQTADELYQSWLEENPAWGWGWIGWADCYTPFGPGKTQDYPRAEQILHRGYAVPGVLEAEHIATARAHLREDRPARRGPGTPAAGRTGTAARRAASTARHGLGGSGRDGQRTACRKAAPGREDRTEPAVPLRQREEVQKCCGAPTQG